MKTGNAVANSFKPVDATEQEVRYVLDVLLHFMRKILTRYENTELAIAVVLEGNLPPDLEKNAEIESNPTAQT